LWADTGDALAGPGKESFGLPGYGTDSVSSIVTVKKNMVLIRATNEGDIVLARKGGPVVGADGAVLPGLTFQRFADPVSGANGTAAFTATLSGRGVNKTNRSGLWAADADGALRMLARSGELAPGGGRWAGFESLVLPDGAPSGPLFTGRLVSSAGEGVNSGNDRGLWGVDSAGTLQLLLRSGDPLSVNGVERTIASFVALAPAAGSLGAAKGFDDNQSVMVIASFTDRTEALVSLTVP